MEMTVSGGFSVEKFWCVRLLARVMVTTGCQLNILICCVRFAFQTRTAFGNIFSFVFVSFL